MVRRKKRTPMPGSGQPVRFYKFVALGFLFVTVLLLGLIVFMSSKRATITILTRPEPIETTFSIQVGDGAASKLSGVVTSTVVSVEKSYNPRGVREEAGVAKGVVTLYNDSSRAQPLVATTRLLTPDGVLFRMSEGATVPPNGSIKANVYADQEGVTGNIGPSDFTIPGLGTARQKEVYAKSVSDMTGGIAYVGVVSQKDVVSAEVDLEAALEEAGGDKLAALYPGKELVYKVINTNITTDVEIGSEVDGFTLSGSARVVGAFYDQSELQTFAVDHLEKQVVGTSESVHESNNAPSAIIEKADETSGVATLGVSYSGLVSLDPNSKDLQRIMFYGKTEDEVRRYVLSLDHVSGVEVRFRPVWNTSVPHVADHVNIVVRQVE